jgi:hypothetical protein
MIWYNLPSLKKLLVISKESPWKKNSYLLNGHRVVPSISALKGRNYLPLSHMRYATGQNILKEKWLRCVYSMNTKFNDDFQVPAYEKFNPIWIIRFWYLFSFKLHLGSSFGCFINSCNGNTMCIPSFIHAKWLSIVLYLKTEKCWVVLQNRYDITKGEKKSLITRPDKYDGSYWISRLKMGVG